eukprot:gene7351-474_t
MAGEYRQALEALYGGAPALQQQANLWLNDFQKQQVAWEAALSCLGSNERTEFAFFSANVLLKKTKSVDWSHLTPEQREQLRVAVSSKFDTWVMDSGNALVVQRLAMVMSAVAVVSGPDASEDLVGRSFSMAAATATQGTAVLQYALHMLLHVAEETLGLDSRRKTALAKRLCQHMEKVMHLVQQVVLNMDSGSGPAAAALACQCLLAWLKLDPDNDGTLVLSPGAFASASGPLFPGLLGILRLPLSAGASYESAASSATDLLVEVLGPGKNSPNPGEDAAALRAAIAGLLALREAVPSTAEGAEGMCTAIARVAAAIIERDTELVVDPHGEQQKIAEAASEYFLMVNTVPVAERHIQLHVQLYSNALPLFMRHAMFPADFTSWAEAEEDEDSFHRFRDFQLADVLRTAFMMFRDVQLADVLETTYNMMKADYLTTMHSAISSATTWQQYEVVLYCIRAVSLRVKARILGRTGEPPTSRSGDPETVRAAAEAHSQLLAIFNVSCGGDASSKSAAAFLSNPWVCRSTSHLIGEYAAWFGKADQVPLEEALRVLLHALCLPMSWSHAAHAFRNVCVRCKDQLCGGTALTGLMDLAARAVAPAPAPGTLAASVAMELDDRLAVVEGLARVIAGLPPATAAEAGLYLIRPIVERAQSLAHAGTTPEQLTQLSTELRLIPAAIRFLDYPGTVVVGVGSLQPHSPPLTTDHATCPCSTGLSSLQSTDHATCPSSVGTTPEQLTQLSTELRLMAAAIRFLDYPGSGGAPPEGQHPALKTLEGAWPILSAVSQAPICQRDPNVVEALCEVYQGAFLFAKSAARPLQSTPIASVLTIFKKAVLSAKSAARPLQSTPIASRAVLSAKSAARPLLSTLIVSVLSIFKESLHASCCDVLGTSVEVFGEVKSHPEAQALQHQALATMCGASAEHMQQRMQHHDIDSCAELVLSFISHLIALPDKLAGDMQAETAQQLARLTSSVSADGERVMSALCTSLCDSCPRGSLRSLSGCIYGFLSSATFGAAASSWFAQDIQGHPGGVPGVKADLLQPEDRQRLCALVLKRPMFPRGRFDALLSDVASIARGEATGDVLLAFEM